MRRMLMAATLASLTFASFAGCTSDDPVADPTPAPTATAASCLSAAAQVVWGTPSGVDPVRIGVYIADDRETAATKTEFFPEGSQVTWDTSGLSQLVSPAMSLAQWEDALLQGLRVTTLVPVDFGKPVTVRDRHRVPIPPAHSAGRVFIVGVEADRTSASFRVRCGDQTISGTVAAPVGSHYGYVSRECGGIPDSSFSAEELSYCP